MNEKTATGRSLKKTWGADYLKWLSKIEFDDPVDNEVLGFYKQCVEDNVERADRLDKQILEAADRPRWKRHVDALTLIKRIDVQTAFLLAVEFGDFRRFKNGCSVSSWIGTVPSDDSSGPHFVRGSITKAGNKHIRHTLIEGVQCVGRVTSKPPSPKKGHDVPPNVVPTAIKPRAACKSDTNTLQKIRSLTLTRRWLPLHASLCADSGRWGAWSRTRRTSR